MPQVSLLSLFLILEKLKILLSRCGISGGAWDNLFFVVAYVCLDLHWFDCVREFIEESHAKVLLLDTLYSVEFFTLQVIWCVHAYLLNVDGLCSCC